MGPANYFFLAKDCLEETSFRLGLQAVFGHLKMDVLFIKITVCCIKYLSSSRQYLLSGHHKVLKQAQN